MKKIIEQTGNTTIEKTEDGQILSISHSLPQTEPEAMKVMVLEPGGQLSEVPESVLVDAETQTPAKEKEKSAKPAKVEKPEFTLLHLKTTGSKKLAQVSLADFITLDSTPIPFAKRAMRTIDKQHVEHLVLALSEGADFPELVGVWSNWGFVVLDGNHRWAAYEQAMEAKCTPEELEQARKEMQITVKPLNGATYEEIINTSFIANRSNGLPTSDNSRAQHALWLIEISKTKPGKPLSVPKAAKMAQVSHVAVYRMAQRIADKEKKMVDQIVGLPEDAETIKEETAKREEKKAEDELFTAVKKIIAGVRSIITLNDNVLELTSYILDSGLVSTQDTHEIHLASHVLMHLAKELKAQQDAEDTEDEEDEEDDDTLDEHHGDETNPNNEDPSVYMTNYLA